MSAEPWRRSGTPVAPRLFAWQAWYFGDLRLDLRGRCGTLETFVDVRGTLATKRDPCGAAAFCVAGVVLWGPQAGFAWQVWYFGTPDFVSGSFWVQFLKSFRRGYAEAVR